MGLYKNPFEEQLSQSVDHYPSISKVKEVTNTPKYYDMPTNIEIEEVLQKYKIDKEKNGELFRDLLNVCSNDFVGGQREEVMKHFEFDEEPTQEQLQMLLDRQNMLRTMPANLKALANPDNKETESLLRKALKSPLDRAAVITKLIQSEQPDSSENKGDSKSPAKRNHKDDEKTDEDGNPIKGMPGPFAAEPDNPAKIWEKLEKKLDQVIEQEQLFGEVDVNKMFRLSKTQAQEMELGAKLDQNINIRAHSTKTYEENRRSRKKKLFQYKDSTHLPKVRKSMIAHPLFDLKIAKKDLLYREGYETHEKKQLLYILVDWSGSMSDYYKLLLRNAYLYNRIAAVARGEAELLYSRYVTNISHFRHIKTKEEAIKFYESERKIAPGGGVCSFGPVLTQAVKKMNEVYSSGNYTRPEILLIHDGQDDFRPVDLGKIRVHGLMLGQDHKPLREYCTATGGSWIVRDFEKEGYPPQGFKEEDVDPYWTEEFR